MSDYADINPRFAQRAGAESKLPRVLALDLNPRPLKLLAQAEAQGMLTNATEAIAILQVGDRLFSGSNPAWREHHASGLHSDMAAYIEVLKDARAGWRSEWIRNKGLDPALYKEYGELEQLIRRLYPSSRSAALPGRTELDQLFALPFNEYHFKLVSSEPTNSSGARAIYHSTRVDHGEQEVRFVPASNSIFAGNHRRENPPKYLCALPRKMENPPINGVEYFELHFCTAVDQHGQTIAAPKRLNGLEALAAFKTAE